MTFRQIVLGTAAALLFVGCGHGASSTGATATDKGTPIAAAAVGKAAPDFTLKDLDGNAVKLSDFRGKPVVLEWMNIDCPVWRGRMEELANTFSRYTEGDEVVWLNVDSTYYMTPEKLRTFATDNGIRRTMLTDFDGRSAVHMTPAPRPICSSSTRRGRLSTTAPWTTRKAGAPTTRS